MYAESIFRLYRIDSGAWEFVSQYNGGVIYYSNQAWPTNDVMGSIQENNCTIYNTATYLDTYKSKTTDQPQDTGITTFMTRINS